MTPDGPIPLLVLGLGNLLCGDDGLGPAAVSILTRKFDVPDGVCVLDGGTLGLFLLPYLEDAREVLLVDAIRADQRVGTTDGLSVVDIMRVIRRSGPVDPTDVRAPSTRLPHLTTALASGASVEPLLRPGMRDASWWEPASHVAIHARPMEPVALAPTP